MKRFTYKISFRCTNDTCGHHNNPQMVSNMRSLDQLNLSYRARGVDMNEHLRVVAHALKDGGARHRLSFITISVWDAGACSLAEWLLQRPGVPPASSEDVYIGDFPALGFLSIPTLERFAAISFPFRGHSTKERVSVRFHPLSQSSQGRTLSADLDLWRPPLKVESAASADLHLACILSLLRQIDMRRAELLLLDIGIHSALLILKIQRMTSCLLAWGKHG